MLEAADELIRIAREAHIPAEIYHLKVAGQPNWHKLDALIQKIEAARAEGLAITADMYNYPAAGTGLDAAMPPWVQEGGQEAWVKRLKDPATRQRVKREMASPADDWENFYAAAGRRTRSCWRASRMTNSSRLPARRSPRWPAGAGPRRRKPPMDLVIEDNARVDAIYFIMSEDNLRKQLKLPWVSFGSDEASLAPEGVFLKSNAHPRAFGNVARLLGRYVRDEKLIRLEEAIRRLTALPAENLKLDRRGALKPGHFADIVVFDPARIQDHATFEQPHQYATGMRDVFVNGVQVLKDGEHTGAKPGQVVHGPGWKKASTQTGGWKSA